MSYLGECRDPIRLKRKDEVSTAEIVIRCTRYYGHKNRHTATEYIDDGIKVKLTWENKDFG